MKTREELAVEAMNRVVDRFTADGTVVLAPQVYKEVWEAIGPPKHVLSKEETELVIKALMTARSCLGDHPFYLACNALALRLREELGLDPVTGLPVAQERT